MKTAYLLVLAGLAVAAPAISHAQVAGSTVLGVSVSEMGDVAVGWSAKRQILGQPVYNSNNDRVGTIDDIIITPDKSVSYASINAGGFLAVTKHDVAVPVFSAQAGGPQAASSRCDERCVKGDSAL